MCDVSQRSAGAGEGVVVIYITTGKPNAADRHCFAGADILVVKVPDGTRHGKVVARHQTGKNGTARIQSGAGQAVIHLVGRGHATDTADACLGHIGCGGRVSILQAVVAGIGATNANGGHIHRFGCASILVCQRRCLAKVDRVAADDVR